MPLHPRLLSVIATMLLAPHATATTLWSGSLVDASAAATQKISVNFPGHGAGRICGVELKTKTMILNHRVWSNLLAGLTVSAEYDDAPGAVTPVVKQEEGGRLYFVFDDNGAAYASLIVSTKTNESVAAYIQRTLGNQQERAVFVAKECF